MRLVLDGAPSRMARPAARVEVWRLATIALTDAAFVLLVAVPLPPAADVPVVEPFPVDWLWLPALVSALTLPLVAYGTLLFSGLRLWRDRVADPAARRVELATVVLSVAGLAVYLSPWGLEATRWVFAD